MNDPRQAAGHDAAHLDVKVDPLQVICTDCMASPGIECDWERLPCNRCGHESSQFCAIPDCPMKIHPRFHAARIQNAAFTQGNVEVPKEIINAAASEFI